MKMLDVYYMYPIALKNGKGLELLDENNKKYLDFYGGHGVISIGHSHPDFVEAVTQQLNALAFYSNAFQNPLQNELAELLGHQSGYHGYHLFLSNSGAEANENALKAASMITGRKKILAVKGAFHGRSAGAVAVTDNVKIRAAFGSQLEVDFIPIDSLTGLYNQLITKEYAAFIIEGIQGVNGVWEADSEYWKLARLLCTQTGTVFIADEIQSGYGRTGEFFAHQHYGVVADIITTGKGMGNGFPVAGTLFHPSLKLGQGMLGTTFGGGQLACASAIAVLKVIENEQLLSHARQMGEFLLKKVNELPLVTAVRGRGLMIGINFSISGKRVRQLLLDDFGIITGFSDPDTLRILPPLTLTLEDCERLIEALRKTLTKEMLTSKEQKAGTLQT
ncbi:MAG TPA: aspartate aminotransferase family protein [Marinilabiliales bacterium]|nr:MAG: acetylornithine aminotransferase [Bacteroidetes bacterium GWA2_40_14]OFX56782.1 MAG: acetylornithine aminotransferase [Bacteroidetes bacterium GWC2_40_13]OFX72880.1 MAG: acetylornithine aminotransferase [Bacteroidetes bacterium GWD2_40_43]OFX93567.1 MAG: acetylornithine aminotransferase [Bacteroidetes bacterium GWE2_40_63]OFY18326.1 MAG: acetylornithine aminotransferase [Bacteroidetes bacterium GWF2_40_13]OFZ27540.1 MAG: acetylornithine aminotransferase [Bacteroidetes bacterium RIFOXYC